MSMDHGLIGRHGQNAVLYAAEVLAPDIVFVTHRPQVAQDVNVKDIRSNWPTATHTPAR